MHAIIWMHMTPKHGLPTLSTLGTVAHDGIALEEKSDTAGLQLRVDAMVD